MHDVKSTRSFHLKVKIFFIFHAPTFLFLVERYEKKRFSRKKSVGKNSEAIFPGTGRELKLLLRDMKNACLLKSADF